VTSGTLGFNVYLTVGLVEIVSLWLTVNSWFQPFNGLLIRIFGRKLLREKKRELAKQIVQALYDRKSKLPSPIEDDDLVLREAAISYSEYFWRLQSRG
jgi:hypothetical protein